MNQLVKELGDRKQTWFFRLKLKESWKDVIICVLLPYFDLMKFDLMEILVIFVALSVWQLSLPVICLIGRVVYPSSWGTGISLTCAWWYCVFIVPYIHFCQLFYLNLFPWLQRNFCHIFRLDFYTKCNKITLVNDLDPPYCLVHNALMAPYVCIVIYSIPLLRHSN